MGYQTIDVKPVSGGLGAELSGVDLSKPLDNQTFSDIYQAFNEHLVVFFRDQFLSPEQHRDFAARFHSLESHPFVEGIDGIPEIIKIVKEPDEVRNWGGPWHADVTFQKEPSVGAVLYAREVPKYGGDTLFANTQLAYETLSSGMKSALENLRAVHESGAPEGFANEKFKGMMARSGAQYTANVHPVVRTHPDTGKKSLFVNAGFVRRFEDMTVEESRPLLQYLFDHLIRPEFTCRFRWRENSIAVWDNRTVLHHATDDDFQAKRTGKGFRRVLHRATLAGQAVH